MKNVKTKVAGLVLAVGVAGGLMAAPAFGAAQFHEPGEPGSANCHGVLVSIQVQGNPAQTARANPGASVQGVQNFERDLCAPFKP